MDMRLCYEAGAVLFWLLFAYLFMDKFLFRGQLGEICFGKARRRMAKALRGAAGWFDPVKEERKKGRGQAKGKTGRKEIPAVVKRQEKELPPVKAEMRPTEKTAERSSEKTVEKQSETDSLVVTKSYGTRQQPPMNATGSGAIAGKENASTFAGTGTRHRQRLHKCRRSASRICSGTSVWKSGGLPRTGVPADMKAMTDREETVTEWIPTS